MDFLRSLGDLARVLQDSQAQAMELAGRILKVDVQQAVQDSAVGARIDLTA